MLRNAIIRDFPQIVSLNEESVRFLSPLDTSRLGLLHSQAAYHRVVELGGTISAFLLAFREGSGYDSPNYRWFCERYRHFLYVDRIVVSADSRGCGIGHRLYEDLFSFATTERIVRVTCEFDVEPPNEISRRFHKRYGFVEVGTQLAAAGTKQVSLQSVSMPLVDPI